MDLTAAEDFKRWQGYTEGLYKRDLNESDNSIIFMPKIFLEIILEKTQNYILQTLKTISL